MLIHGPKKKFWTLQSPALWFPASGGGGPIVPAHVQGNLTSNGASSSTTVAVTLGAAVSASGCVCLSFGAANSTGTTVVSGVTDDKGNTYSKAFGIFDTTDQFEWVSFFATGISNGPTTFTATFTVPRTFSSITADEFSGVLATSALDGTPASQNQQSLGSGTNATSGNTTSTASGGLVYGSILNVTGAGTQSVGPGFTQDQTSAGLFLIEHLVQGSAGAIAATAVHTATDSFSSGVYVLKHA